MIDVGRSSYRTCSALLEGVPLVVVIDLDLGKAFSRAVRASLTFNWVELLCRLVSRIVGITDVGSTDGLRMVHDASFACQRLSTEPMKEAGIACLYVTYSD